MTIVTRAVAAALCVAGVLSAVPADATTSYGHTGSRDRELRSGCHNYRYHYVINTPTNDWTLETFLVDPTGDTIASGTFIAGTDPRRGPGWFRFCRYATRPGTFTIRAKVHWYDGPTDHKRWFEPSHFRLTR